MMNTADTAVTWPDFSEKVLPTFTSGGVGNLQINVRIGESAVCCSIRIAKEGMREGARR